MKKFTINSFLNVVLIFIFLIVFQHNHFNEKTALHAAVEENQIEIINLLLGHEGIDTNITDEIQIIICNEMIILNFYDFPYIFGESQ